MSLKDELAEIIQAARDAKRRRQTSLIEARDWWNEFKEKDVRPILVEATTAFREAGVFSLADRTNGDAVYIGVGPSNKAPQHELSFRLENETGLVRCESSEATLAQTYEKGSLTAEKVRDKVREFVRAVIENYV